MGAIISRAHLERVEQYVAHAKEEGAHLLTGGQRPAGRSSRKASGSSRPSSLM